MKINSAAGVAWQDSIEEARRGGVELIQKVSTSRFPIFEEIIKYDNRQFVEEIMPIYHKMLQHFTDKMHFAETATISQFENLVNFVEIWDR